MGGLAGRLTGFLGIESAGDRLGFVLSERIRGWIRWISRMGWLVSLRRFLDRGSAIRVRVKVVQLLLIIRGTPRFLGEALDVLDLECL